MKTVAVLKICSKNKQLFTYHNFEMIKKFSVGLIAVVLIPGWFAVGSPLESRAVESWPGEGMVFADVGEDDAYFEALGYLKEKDIISGYPDGTFRPYQTINRAEFTKIIIGSTGEGYSPLRDPSGYDIYSLIGVPFSDVENGAWYIPYLREAKDALIIDGYPDGTFKPAQEINFAEAAKIVVNAMGYETAGPDPSEWYKPYVDVLSAKKAIPHTINSFDQKISRGEMAEMIYRLTEGSNYGAYQTYAGLAAPKGYLNGSLSYPSEGIPLNMLVCATESDSGAQYCTYEKILSENYLYGMGYKLPVPAGSYQVMAYVGTYFGGYSEFVTCGMDFENCTSHELVSVPVKAGETVRDIDIMDWYFPDYEEANLWADDEGGEPMENPGPLYPAEWWRFESADGQIAAEEVIEFGVLLNYDGDQEYFLTSDYADDLSSVTLHIYSCATGGACHPQELWQETYPAGEFDQLGAMGSYLPYASLVAWLPTGAGDAGSLVLAFRDIDSAEDPCIDPVLAAMEGGNGRGFAVFDLTTRTMSFGNYEPSQMVYDYAEVRQLNCQEEAGGPVG